MNKFGTAACFPASRNGWLLTQSSSTSRNRWTVVEKEYGKKYTRQTALENVWWTKRSMQHSMCDSLRFDSIGRSETLLRASALLCFNQTNSGCKGKCEEAKDKQQMATVWPPLLLLFLLRLSVWLSVALSIDSSVLIHLIISVMRSNYK